jgi:hypothetical protein
MTEKKKKGGRQKVLFGKSDVSRAGYLVLSARAVRGFLATGVVRVPGEKDVFAAGQDLVGQGRRVLADDDLKSPLTVASPKDGCVAEVSGDMLGAHVEILDRPFPATGIMKLIFATQREADDWLARSRSFEGLGPLPEVEAGEGLVFESPAAPELDESESPASEPATPEQPEGPEDEPEIAEFDHLAGGLVTLLETGFDGFEWMRRLESDGAMTRVTLAETIAAEIGEDLVRDSARVSEVLSILQEPKWNQATGLLDAQAMLDRFVELLGDDAADEEYTKKVSKWSDYVRAILDGTGDARSNGLLDEGDIFLRALELILRTKPMFVAGIDEQKEVYGDDLGQKVSAIARILAGWYQGFGDLAGAAKQPMFYSLGCRIAAGLLDYPVRLTVRTANVGDFDTRYSLSAGDSTLQGYLDSPPDAIKGFFHNAQIATKRAGWEVRYWREDSSIHFTRDSEKVVGTVKDDTRIRLQSDFKLSRRGARTWLKGFQDEILKLSSDLRCTPSSPTGYPDLLLHCHQLISTTDHDEILDHLEALVEGKKLVSGMHGRLVRKRSSAS